MKKFLHIITLAVLYTFSAKVTTAQTTARDFKIIDCKGNPQHLFSDLNGGKVVILEFFMKDCEPCIDAGKELELMRSKLLSKYPGKIKAYTFGFNDVYTCDTINKWISNNGFTSVPADSGDAQVTYYGGMGMPSIVILGGGSKHSVLGAPYIGLMAGDTTNMATDIRNFLNSTGINDNNNFIKEVAIFPNPANEKINLSFIIQENANLNIDILDLTGRLICNVLNEKIQPGKYTKNINTYSLSKGSYFIKINANGIISQQKLTIIH